MNEVRIAIIVGKIWQNVIFIRFVFVCVWLDLFEVAD
jgi:hypothetical protein